MKWLLSAWLAFAWGPAAPLAAQEAPSLARVLTHAREALGLEGIRAHKGGILLEGRSRTLGLTGTFRMLFTARGEFLQEVRCPLPFTTGFDGQTGWQRDWNHTSGVLELGDLENAQAFFWVFTGRWLEDDGPFQLELLPPGTGPAEVAVSLRRKEGIYRGKLVLDPKTWLVKTLSHTGPSGEDLWVFEDPREEQGFRLPHRLIHREGGFLSEEYWVEKTSPAPQFLRNPYQPVLTHEQVVQWDPAVPADLEVKKTRTGHLLVRPRVDGKDVGWFVFDSGAGGLILDPRTGDDLGLDSFGSVPVGGVGGLVAGAFRRAGRFQLGPLSILDPVFVEVDLRFLEPAFGVPVAGVAGYPVFANAVVELEKAKSRVALHPPGGFRLKSGTWQRLFLYARHPCVKARFEGDRAGIFKLDTGAAGTVLFHAPAVAKWGLLEDRETFSSTSGGVGGRQGFEVGTLEWFELGGRRFRRLQAGFSTAQKGAFLDPYTAGNIGTELLADFVVFFDYPQRRIAFVPRRKKKD